MVHPAKIPFCYSKRPQQPSVRSQFWGRRASGSKPDSLEDLPCMAPTARHTVAKCPPVAVVWRLGDGTGSCAVLVI
ncbi:hypothetical protein AVEN_49440-1 [Araneus ventricosus]|uniref:Uncharacterized protein n=1 Tax=Araneus ventricosus TaxID=182803 RepID=A0A4Y2CNQ9_ARAVE|nr:hypothetical protein AVEN_49440-1 [Araneus ventricosus]